MSEGVCFFSTLKGRILDQPPEHKITPKCFGCACSSNEANSQTEIWIHAKCFPHIRERVRKLTGQSKIQKGIMKLSTEVFSSTLFTICEPNPNFSFPRLKTGHSQNVHKKRWQILLAPTQFMRNHKVNVVFFKDSFKNYTQSNKSNMQKLKLKRVKKCTYVLKIFLWSRVSKETTAFLGQRQACWPRKAG